MQNGVTLDYLLEMTESLTKQAEQHYANWQATLGALDLLRHLVEVAQQQGAPNVPALQLAGVEDDE